jgi:diguanylate cyclase (GGDEF)-like protein/PAS domain S-box-containing protein
MNPLSVLLRFWSRLGLLKRLVVALGLLILVVATTEMYLMVRNGGVAYRTQHMEQARELSQFLVPLLAEQAVIGDYATIRQLLAQQVEDRIHVKRIDWTSANGKVLSVESHDLRSKTPRWFANLADIPPLKESTSVVLGGQHYGELVISFAPVAAENRLWKQFAGQVLERVVLVALSFLMIVLILRGNLATVDRLAQGADRFSRGDHAVRIPVHGAPEVRAAAHAFNNMAEELSRLMTNLSESHRELHEQLHFTRELIEALPNPIYFNNKEGVCLGVNRAWEAFFGVAREQSVGAILKGLDSGPLAVAPAQPSEPTPLHQAGHASNEVTVTGADGRPYRMLYYKAVFTKADGTPAGLIGMLVDITQHKDAQDALQRSQDRLSFLAYYDNLTSLPNRALLMERMQQAMLESRRMERLVAILFLDLDRFKFINDTLGHDIGDALLKMVAERLAAQLRPGDTVSRYGGDEFTIVLANVAHLDDVTRIAQKILERFAHPFHIGGRDLFVTSSIGITLYPHDDSNGENLLKNADAAMYHAKERGRNTFQFYTAEMNVRAARRLSIETGLRHALDRKELSLHYQPQVDLKSGNLYGMEALLRWHSPEFGLVSPVEFIPLAEDTGLIQPIGEWVLRTACAQTRAWHRAGFPDLRIAVNLSARQFQRQNLVQIIRQTLTDSGLEPQYLDLELTESMLMHDMEHTVSVLKELDALGVALSVDDFGTGYSSLSYLKRFPIDVLKIDRSFVRDITASPDDAAIVTAIIAMAHSLEIKVIAEGVETLEQQEFLKQRDCDGMQGYYFSKPLSVEDFTRLLKKNQRLRLVPGAGDATRDHL